jgi:hypothetical protein
LKTATDGSDAFGWTQKHIDVYMQLSLPFRGLGQIYTAVTCHHVACQLCAASSSPSLGRTNGTIVVQL